MFWKCTVCGYIHKESEPPDNCPVCGAARDRFIAVDADGQPIAAGPEIAGDASTDIPAVIDSAANRWKCQVCGYIHEGAEPPDTCPVCGADRSRFIPVDADGAPIDDAAGIAAAAAADSDEDTTTVSDPVRRWKCTVCGYIHTGAEPPEKCPVCGADRSRFSEVIETVPPKDTSPSDTTAAGNMAFTPDSPWKARAMRYYEILTDLMVRQHAHPISVHIPNGVAPVAVLFLFLAVLFQSSTLEIAATCNMVVVLLAMPIVIFSGVNDWKKRFGGNMTQVFLTKIVCAGIISVLLVMLVVWRVADPDIARSPGGWRTLYLFLHAVLIAAAAIAGFMGGKLVFPHE